MCKVMIELPVKYGEDGKTMLQVFDVAAIETFYPASPARKDDCVVRMSCGRSYLVNVGYDELKERICDVSGARHD